MRFLSRILALGLLLALAGLLTASDVRKEDVPRLIKDLKSPVAKTRLAAAQDLGEIGAIKAADAKDAVPYLLQVVKKDKDAKVREAAALALGKMSANPKEAVPVLIEALKDKENAVRAAAARALGQLGPDAKDAVPALEELRKSTEKDKDKGVMRAAGDALKSIRAK
jgi:HEAT repeat protein